MNFSLLSTSQFLSASPPGGTSNEAPALRQCKTLAASLFKNLFKPKQLEKTVYRIHFSLIILLISCNPKPNKNQTHKSLIKWQSEFVMEDGASATPFYTEHEKFIKPYFKTVYQNDTIVVSTLMEVNACGESIADIKISHDTLYLLTKNISNEVCTSVVFLKFTYFISNPSNKQYIIVSEN